MDARELLWCGFQGLDASDVALEFQPGGIVLFARNLDPDPQRGPARCQALIRSLQHRWGQAIPIAVAIDQEGGAVSRLRAWVGPTPSFHRIWQRQGVEGCRRWGALWGRGLRMLGINVDFAPVADLHDGHQGTGLGERAASSDPRDAALAVGAFLSGLEGTRVRGCLKHFPGLGGTLVDSHQSLPVLEDMDRVGRNARVFQPLAHEDRLVMVAHLQTPLSGSLPASLHRESVIDNPWGVRARFIPDDLEMGGCAADSWETRVQRCLEAGHQALLVCQTPAGISACAEAARHLPEDLWKPALGAFRGLRLNLWPPEAEAFDAQAWQAWVQDVQIASAELGDS